MQNIFIVTIKDGNIHWGSEHNLIRYVFRKDGSTSKLGKSTTKLSVGKFIEYIERIKHWADENGVYIPEADPELSHNNASFIRPLTKVL